MSGSLASFCGLLYFLSEVALGVAKRAPRGEAQAKDAGSLRLLWIVIVLSVVLAYLAAGILPDFSFGSGVKPLTQVLGLGCFGGGLFLRWYAIVYLGKFFTVNVAIAHDHRVIDAGPYRYVRHPSYTGALAAFLGLGLLLNNAASLALMVVPTVLVFLRRMQVEEAALVGALGEQYRAYMRRTRRLVPGLY